MAAPEELDLDPIEPAREEPKAKATARSGKETRAAEEKDARADARTRREADPRGRKVPYPASPPDVPDGLTDYPESYIKQQNLLLAGLFVFLIFYIGMILLFAMIGFWCVWSLHHWPILKVVGIVFSSIFFLYLVKGFFKRHPMDKEMHIEITEEEQPVLFEFIYRLCDELDAPLPNKVFVSPDVNAAVMPRASLINLFVEPKKDLLIGLGLVNCMNLTEFKSVLAHEFGHFTQSAMSSSYSYVASRIIIDLISGEDWFDRMVNWCKKQQNAFSVIGYGIGGPLWVGRAVMWSLFKVITLQRMAVMRESEFHADLVAVKAAGSDAVALSLFRMRFGNLCFMQAAQDMAVALDHKLYSRDMFLHQDRAAEVVRRKRKDPQLGVPPLLEHPLSGKTVRVFEPEEEDLTDDVPEMRRTHPPAHELEDNAKETFIPAVVDYRSPWVLFDEPADLKERMTYKFYRMVFRIPKNADLADAVTVQMFIDNEHADTTYDPKYKGAYDERILEPGDLSELNGLIRETPWTEERMAKVLDKLYDGCEEHAEAHSELYKELETLTGGIVGRPSKTMRRKIEEVEQKQETNREWFKSFDRRVYLLHIQMAAQVDKETRAELVERYRFQLEVQRFYFEARQAYSKADAYFSTYIAAAQGKIQVSSDFGGEVMQVLRESWKTLKNIIKDAREINLPAMKNFEEGDNLADFILEGKMVPEPPLSYVKGVWINKLMTQLQGVRLKCFRLHFKSVGGILRLHEAVSDKWKALREPVAAEVLEDEPVAAEVIEDEPIAAEVIPAEVLAEELPAEVIPAEVIPAEVIAEPLPAVPAAAPAPPKAMAAFVLSVAALPSADPFDFRPPAPAVPAPTAANETFSPDSEAVAPAEPAAPAPKPRPTPVALAAPVAAAEIFSLDSEEAEPAEPVEVAFSLDMDDHEPAPKSASGVFPAAASTPTGSTAVPAPAPRVPASPAKPLSGVVDAPPAKPAFGSGGSANGKRPPIKITMVKPGETSPLSK